MFVFVRINCETKHHFIDSPTGHDCLLEIPAWGEVAATQPNNLSQNICNQLTLALTFKSIFSYSSQKTLSMAKETQEKDSSTNTRTHTHTRTHTQRYRGNSTQIRWQEIIQLAHFYSAPETGTEFIFTLSLFMLFKHNIH